MIFGKYINIYYKKYWAYFVFGFLALARTGAMPMSFGFRRILQISLEQSALLIDLLGQVIDRFPDLAHIFIGIT